MALRVEAGQDCVKTTFSGRLREMSTLSWPEAGVALVRELREHPGRLALAPVGDGLEAIAALLETVVTSVGLTLTTGQQPSSVEAIESRLAGGVF